MNIGNRTYERTHTSTLEGLFSLYLEFQVEDPAWRLGDSQIVDVNLIKNVLYTRA